jgi:glycosyltransferase involved in cell wall biosynthesis
MKICLIAEGCYPYVAGGVSSWIQMLVKGMPQHEFTVFTIGSEEKLRGQYKYEIPENITKIEEHFLDEYTKCKEKKSSKIKLTKEQRDTFIQFLLGEKIDWGIIFEMFQKKSNISVNQFLISREFLKIVEKICETKYAQTSFKEVFWTIRSMLLPVLSIIKTEPPKADIYHCVSTGYAGIVGAKFKYDTGKPLIVTEHGIYTREREEEIIKAEWVDSQFKSTWIHFFTSISYSAYAAGNVITSLFAKARQFQIELGADEKKCIVIPNGINTEIFAHIEPLKEKKEDFVIGAIVRVVPIKDIKTMIYSFNTVRNHIKNAKLYIIGPYNENPEYYQECLELIENLDCKGIEFVGRVNISEWLEKVDITLLTSISEGQPFVLLESFAAKRPVVATDVGSCREMVEGLFDEYGEGGIITPVMNPSIIARVLIKLSKDRKLMIRMAEQGYQRTMKYYKEEVFLEEYENIYRRLQK